jgi:cysteinyl-tRNA synthetase
MSIKYLGEAFDIHAGGIDHIPIHHTNEIAQSEAATGITPWVKYWLHNEFLVLDKEKMAKSDGNFITLQNLVDRGFDPLDYRYFLLGGHYRSQLQFSMEGMQGAKNSRKSLVDKVRLFAKRVNQEEITTELHGGNNKDSKTPCNSVSSVVNNSSEPSVSSVVKSSIEHRYLQAFNKAIEDDLNTPRALAELWGLLKEAPPTQEALAVVFDMDRILGLGLEEACMAKEEKPGVDEGLAREIEELIAKRAEAKKAKDFTMADNIRQNLKERGIILEDGPAGTIWRIHT